MSEKAVENQIKAYIKNLPSSEGNFVFKVHGTGMTKTAIPDLIGAYFGKPFAIEVKAVGGKLSPKQKITLALFKRGGYNTGVAYCLDDAIRIMKS